MVITVCLNNGEKVVVKEVFGMKGWFLMEICYDGRSYTKVVFQCFFGRFWELIRVFTSGAKPTNIFVPA